MLLWNLNLHFVRKHDLYLCQNVKEKSFNLLKNYLLEGKEGCGSDVASQEDREVI